MDFGFNGGMGDDFNFGGGYGAFGSVFGVHHPDRNREEDLPALNLTNREDEDEEEEVIDRSPSVASSSPARDKPPSPAPAASSPPAPRPKPKPAYRGAGHRPPTAQADETPTQVPTQTPTQEEVGNKMWEEQETESWPEELQKAFAGFARAKSRGGEKWKRCVLELVALERVWGFPSKGLLAVPNSAEDRPGEVERFMCYGRKWGSRMDLTSEIGPSDAKDSFAGRWWNWWCVLQPESRKNGDSEMRHADEVPREEWEDIGKMAGRNGVLLYVGALLWWGEAAAAAPEAEKLLEDWRLAVDDVAAVLGEARKGLEAK
jgi:hypothetical protein